MNTTSEGQILPLPAGYTTRAGRHEDYKIAFDLLNIHSQHMNSCDDLNDPELIRLDWLNDGFNPKFLRRFAEVAADTRQGIKTYAAAVRDGSYPAAEHSFD